MEVFFLVEEEVCREEFLRVVEDWIIVVVVIVVFVN